jgi:translocation and assembly module TamB
MRRALRISAWVLGALVLFAGVLGGALFIAGNTDTGRALIERLTYRLSAGQVKLSGLAGSFPAQLTLDRLQLSDVHGVWLTAEHIALHWEPLELLIRRVQVDSLEVSRINIERAPVTSQHSGDVSIPHIGVHRLSVAVLELGPQLVGTAASLSVNGSGQLRSLQDAAADLSIRRIGGDGEYELHFRFDPARMDGTLKAHEPAGGPLENLLQFPGLGDLSATMKLSGPRRAERVDLVVDAGDLHGRAQGSVDLTDRSAELDYSLDAPAMQPRPELAWQRLALRGRWRGNLATPVADGHLEVEKLRLAGGTELATLNATLNASTGMISVDAVVDGLTIPGPGPRLLQQDPLKIAASMRLNEATRPLELTATHKLLSLRVQAVTAGQQSASIDLRLADLAPFAALGGQNVRGTAAINAQVTRGAKDVRLTLSANANFTGGTASWVGVLGDKAALQLTGALNDAAISVERLQLTGRASSVSLSGSAARPAPGSIRASGDAARGIGDWISDIRMRWQLDVANLGVLSTALAGRLNASGNLNGPPTALTSDAQLASTFSVHGSPSSTISGIVHARGLPAAPSITLQVQGTVDEAPLTLDAALERNAEGSFRALLRRADWKSARLDGDVSIDRSMTLTRGQFNLTLGQLGDLDRLLGAHLQGSVEATADFKPLDGRAHARFHVEAHDLVAGQFAANAQLSGEGPLNAVALQFAAQSADVGGFPVKLSSSALLNPDTRELEVTSAGAEYRGETLRLLSPTRLSFLDGITIKQLKLGAQQAVLEIDGRVSPTLDLRVSLRQVNPALVNAFVPGLLAEGTIAAEASLQGSVATPTGRVSVNAIGIRVANDASTGLPALAVHSAAQLKGDTATIDAQFSAGTAQLLTISGSVPLNLEGTLDLKMSGKVSLGLINPLLEASGQHAAGELSIDATLVGAASAPQIQGTIHLAQGSLRDYSRGVSLSDINGEIVGSEGKLQIKSLTAAAASGNVSVTGTIGVLQTGIPVDLKLVARNAQPIASSIVTANLDADIHVSGTARERIDVVGTVHLNRTDIGIPSTLPPNLAVLDVRRRGQSAPPPLGRRLVIGVDVAVQAPRQVLIKGRGLEAELGGDLHFRGTTDALFVTGGFDLQRGSFTIAGNKLNFTAGRVSFDGAGLRNKIDPTLDFTAQSYVTDATVILHISGYADSPKFDFSSTPSLPQDDIMARLLFGVASASQLSALQLAQVGAALATLSGVGGDSSLNPLVRLQKSLGLDRLTVGSNTVATPTGTTNSGASIEAGRYVSKRVYVEAKQSTTGSTQVQVDVDLTKHLKLQTRLGNGTAITQGTTPDNDPGSSIGLSYQFEY